MAHVGRDGIGRKRGNARWVVPSLALVWVGLASIAFGQFEIRPPVPRSSTKVYFDTSHKADADLRSADNHAKAGDYAEAVDIYQRVIQQFGDKVVDIAIEPGGGGETDSRLSVNARLECQRRIAALPPEARALYRARVDSQAERWFRLGKEQRDRTLLHRIVDQSFCSSWGDDALELLGDLAFQDGEFAEAIAAYTQLVPDRPMGSLGLVHPDPSFDLARVEAKKLLCRAAIGEHPPTASELAEFARAHPATPGPFAGRKDQLAVDLARAIGDDHLARPTLADGRWPTFAGSPTRTRVAPGPIDVGSLQWKVELEVINPVRTRYGRMNMGMGGMGNPGAQPPPERLLAYHPIVFGDQVIIENEKQIIAYNLNTRPGDRETPASTTGAVEVAWKTPDLMGGASAQKPSAGLARYTLTAFGDRIFARIGQPPSSSPPMNRMGMGMSPPGPSYIVAVERTQGKLLWKREASDIPLPKRQVGGGIGSKNAVFEGSPVADARNVYVAITDRIEMTATYVVCLDAETGATRWARYICEANSNVDPLSSAGFEISHRLVTLDGPTLYYQTNLGAVASLDAESGSIRWLATYPWQGRNGEGQGRERDLNPAIVHDGLVIVSPDDTKRIYAFEAATGRLAWKTDEIAEEVRLTHLLGVAKGKLIATGDQVLWFDVKTGKKVHVWPDNPQGTQGFGRGILAGDRIYWPTETEIHVFDQETGLKADAPIKLGEFQCKGGNLAVGDGYLIVAQANSLVVFCQNSRLIDRYRDEIARAPDQAANYYRLAQAAEAIGQDDLALSNLEDALPRARASESIDGSPLVEAIRDHQRQLLMKLGQKAKIAKDWVEAGRRFSSASGVSRSDRDRLSALLELSEVQLAQGDSKATVATLQGLLSDERVRSLTIDTADGQRSVRADLLIADRIASLLRDKGRGLYAEFDRAASDLLARGKAEKDPRLLEDVGRSYPVASVVPIALSELGAIYEDLRRPGDAARVYKKLMILAPDDRTRASSLWGLARAYEAQKLWVSAREAYLNASQRFGGEPIVGAGSNQARPLAALVAERLAREPFDRMMGDRAEPIVPVPLRRRWERHWAETSRPIGADGIPPSAEAGRVFLAHGREIRPVDPTSGASAWSRDLEGEPVWVGYLADRIIAATRTRIVALSLDKGEVEWRYDLCAAPVAGVAANPFAKEPAADGAAEKTGMLLDFRIVGNRVFCLKGHQPRLPAGGDPDQMIDSLMAFDGDTGLVDWSYTPANGRINRQLLVGPRRIVLQVRKPNLVLVLDTSTGRRQGEFPQGEAEEWPREPLPLDDDHIALVVNRTKVAKFDITKGSYAWEFEETKESPRFGPPRLFCDSERLLVLHEGQSLMRLDLATGSKVWKNWRLLGNENLSERPEAIALVPGRAFVVNGSTLAAFDVADGSLLWKRPLSGPASGWDLALTERSVVAFPAPSVEGLGLSVLPLVFHRREDGEPIQRLLFQVPVTQLAIRFSSRGALVATQAGGWAIGDRQVMDGSRAPR
jgi:cellulose synthase operon protein C